MSGGKRILAATDLSDSCVALDSALFLAAQLGGEVVLVHAIEASAGGAGTEPLRVARASSGAMSGRTAVLSSTSVVRMEDPGHLVSVTVEELGVEVVVLGAGDTPGAILRRLLREGGPALWLARRGGHAVERIRSRETTPFLEHLATSLRVPLVPHDSAGRSGDLLALSVSRQTALSRLYLVSEALSEHSGPILVHYERESPGDP